VIAAHELTDFSFSPDALLREECSGGHDLPGGAIAALKCIMMNEGFLDGMQLPTRCEAFDGGDFATIALGWQRQAREHARAIEKGSCRHRMLLDRTPSWFP
jgi:hypothetical protein